MNIESLEVILIYKPVNIVVIYNISIGQIVLKSSTKVYKI
jgi:hypothetical protein